MQEAVSVSYKCTHTWNGCVSADYPAVDFAISAAVLLARLRLVDGKRDHVFGIKMLKHEGIHVHLKRGAG